MELANNDEKSVPLKQCFFISFSVLSGIIFSIKNERLLVTVFCFIISIIICFLLFVFKRTGLQKFVYRMNLLDSSVQQKLVICFCSLLTCCLYLKNSVFFNKRVLAVIDISALLSKHINIDANLFLIILSVLIGIVIFPAVYIIWKAVVLKIFPLVRSFLKGMSKFEIMFVVISFSVVLFWVIFATIRDTVFFKYMESGTFTYDGVFGADSGYIFYFDYLCSPILDDVRHPMMGLVSLPACMLAWIFGMILSSSSLFHININLAYGIGLVLAQSLCVAFIGIMLYRMIRPITSEIFSKIFIFFYAVSCPALLYSLIIERYAFISFYLILFIYVIQRQASYKLKLAGFIAAVGTISTSVLLVPYLLKDCRGRKVLYKRIMYLFTVAFFIIFFTGRLAMLLNVLNVSGRFISGSGNVLHVENIWHFFSFILSLFIIPNWHVAGRSIVMSPIAITISWNHFISIIIVLLCVLGLILGRKERMIRITVIWILLSIFLVGILGLGCKINETVLYSLYFSWAFLIPLSYALYKLLRDRIAFVLLFFFGVIMFFYNSIKLFNMITAVMFK